MTEGGWLVVGSLVRRGELIMQSHSGVLIDVTKLERLFIPADRRFGHSFVKEALRQPGVGLHNVWKGMAMFHSLANLLQLTDGFVEQPHFAEGYAEIVMRLGIFVGGGYVLLEFVLQFPEHLGQIHPRIRADLRRRSRLRQRSYLCGAISE